MQSAVLAMADSVRLSVRLSVTLHVTVKTMHLWSSNVCGILNSVTAKNTS